MKKVRLSALNPGDEVILVHTREILTRKKEKGIAKLTLYGVVTKIEDGTIELKSAYMLPAGIDMDTADDPNETLNFFREYVKAGKWGPTELRCAKSKYKQLDIYRTG